jgi:hypothetical protein
MSNALCVFFNCSKHSINRKKNKPIYKLVDNTFFVSNELTNIQRIQNFKNHFYVCAFSEELELKEVENNCASLSLYNDIKKDNQLLLTFENREIIYFKNYLKTCDLGHKYVNAIIQSYKYLLSSICLLVEHHLVHNNIQFETVCVDSNQNVLLTDFSLSLNMSVPNMETYMRYFIVVHDPSYFVVLIN